MNEQLRAIFSDHLHLVLMGVLPMAAILLFLLLTLLLLRMRARKKSARMDNAEREMTGLGATTWDSYQGPATLGPPTFDPSCDPAATPGKPGRSS